MDLTITDLGHIKNDDDDDDDDDGVAEAGDVCAVCEYYAHVDCQDFAVSDCKECATYVPPKLAAAAAESTQVSLISLKIRHILRADTLLLLS